MDHWLSGSSFPRADKSLLRGDFVYVDLPDFVRTRLLPDAVPVNSRSGILQGNVQGRGAGLRSRDHQSLRRCAGPHGEYCRVGQHGGDDKMMNVDLHGV